jgi:hypothetical protein
MYMVWHQMPFENLAFCRASEWKIAPNCRLTWPKITFRRRLGTNTT